MKNKIHPIPVSINFAYQLNRLNYNENVKAKYIKKQCLSFSCILLSHLFYSGL